MPSWRPGHFVWPGGRTKIVLLGGIGSRTGDPTRSFQGLIGHLVQRGGYDARRDILEGTYAGGDVDGQWRPRPYTEVDTRRPLLDIADAVAGCLEWYRERLPADARLLLVGYSLGGVAALDGTTLALARDRAGWDGRLVGVVTLAAPVRGCNVGSLMSWAWLATGDPEGLGLAGQDLDHRWRDSDEQRRVERRAAFLRSTGARLLTLADPDDAVVRPDEALLPGPGETRVELLVRPESVRPGTLGHGALLEQPAVWRRIFDLVGPQQVSPADVDVDPIAAELEALKQRLRAEGRIA